MFNAIVTTMGMYTEDELKVGGIIDSSKIQMSIKEYQTVIAVGNTVKDIKVGDLVKINPERYKVRKYKEDSIKNDINTYNPVEQYQFKTVTIDNKQCLLLYDSDIQYIVEEFEEEEPQSDIIVPNNDIIH
jgi:hypothetical protein